MPYSLIFDAHLDLSMNAMDWNRDLTQPLTALRQREAGQADKPDRGRGTVCFPEMRRGRIGLCVATLIARYVHRDNPLPGWHSPAQAHAHTQGQLAWYRAMERAGELVQINNLAALNQHVAAWQAGRSDLPVGYILSLEGADSIQHPDDLERAWEQGLRALGPAHYGPGTYAKGTNSFGGLGSQGPALLRKMEELGIILDLTHLSDRSFWEALEHFNGPVWASHNNCRALVPHQRQFDDHQLREIIRRDGVIGLAMDAWMIIPGWIKGRSQPDTVGLTLNDALDHVDHICQLAGNARHVMLGTDLDGGFGREQSPADIDSIADLQKIPALLEARGYAPADIDGLLADNGLRFLRQTWR